MAAEVIDQVRAMRELLDAALALAAQAGADGVTVARLRDAADRLAPGSASRTCTCLECRMLRLRMA